MTENNLAMAPRPAAVSHDPAPENGHRQLAGRLISVGRIGLAGLALTLVLLSVWRGEIGPGAALGLAGAALTGALLGLWWRQRELTRALARLVEAAPPASVASPRPLSELLAHSGPAEQEVEAVVVESAGPGTGRDRQRDLWPWALTGVSLGVLAALYAPRLPLAALLVLAVVLLVATLAALHRAATALRGIDTAAGLLAEGRHEEANACLAEATARVPRLEAFIRHLAETDAARRLEEAGQAQALAATRAERDMLARIVDSAPSLVVALDEGWRITAANARAASFLGRSREDLRGHGLADMLGLPAAAAARLQAGLQALADGTRAMFEYEGESPDHAGVRRRLAWAFAPLPGSSGSGVLGMAVDVGERAAARGPLGTLSERDALTGLRTAQAFLETLEGDRDDLRGGLLCLNIARFRYINELGGYPAGDQLLCGVAEILRSVAPEDGVAARVGADEFALWLPDADAARSEAAAAHIAARVAELTVSGPTGTHRPSAMVGLAVAPEHANTADELFANAAAALTEARQTGAGRAFTYRPEAGTREHMRATIEALETLEDALSDGRVIFHFQPVVCTRGGAIHHREALLRVVTADGAVLPPGQFIAAAERHGPIERVDAWALEHAVRTLAQAAPTDRRALAFNLSGGGLRDAGLVDRVEELLLRHAVPPGQLIIEVAEADAIHHLDAAREVMRRLRHLGCRFALDDFGAGHSSLNYLRELPVDFVKIDGSFITGLASNPERLLMVRAIHEVARGLGLETVAKFVDSAATLNALAEVGVDYAQGFYTGRPEPELHPGAPRTHHGEH